MGFNLFYLFLGYIFIYMCQYTLCVCLVSVECKAHCGNKKITPVCFLSSASFFITYFLYEIMCYK